MGPPLLRLHELVRVMNSIFRSPIVKKLGLVLGGLLFSLLLAEIGLRVLGVGFPMLYAPDEYCGTRLLPNARGRWSKEGNAAIVINEHGFRHGDRRRAKPDNCYRIAVLGDSFVEGLQVNESLTYCSQLETALNRSKALGEKRVEVLNFGVSGYGTAQSLEMLKHHVWEYEPDLVLLMFFPGNDVRNNSIDLEPYKVRPFYRVTDETLTLDDSFHANADYQKAQTSAVKWKVRLINSSRILQLVNELRNRAPQQTASDEPAELGLDDHVLAPPKGKPWQDAWVVSEQLLSELSQTSGQGGAAFRLVVLGTALQVDPRAERREGMAKRLGVESLDYPQTRLLQWADEVGVTAFDLAEPMRAVAMSQQKYLHGFPNTKPGEGHWNELGNRTAAELVADWLARDTLVVGE